MRVLNLFFTTTNNTKRVAETIEQAVTDLGHEVNTLRVKKDTDPETVDLLDHDFVFIGSGVYEWLPGKPMMDFLSKSHKKHMMSDMVSGDIKPCAPRKPGKMAIAYCTYGGCHLGINEAVPTTKYLMQLFDHLGFTVIAEWHIPGEYHGKYKALNEIGRLGDITGRPNQEDLRQVREMTTGILRT